MGGCRNPRPVFFRKFIFLDLMGMKRRGRLGAKCEKKSTKIFFSKPTGGMIIERLVPRVPTPPPSVADLRLEEQQLRQNVDALRQTKSLLASEVAELEVRRTPGRFGNA